MQTLRFYTRRVFSLVFLLFTGALIAMVLLSNSRDGGGPRMGGGGEQQQRQQEVPFALPFSGGEPAMDDYRARQDWRRFHPLAAQLGAGNRAGEQMPFQPQPPPLLNSPPVKYSDLNIARKIDRDLVERIRAHLRKAPKVAAALAAAGTNHAAATECAKNVTLAEYWKQTQSRTVPTKDSWERFYAQIGSCELYHDDKAIDQLLADMTVLPIKHVAIMEGGTQVKLVLTFDNDKQAVFKPMRFGRDYETDPNHFYFGDFERHNAEIATFHLDRILGYRRAVPTVGRVVNITSELMENSERRLRKTFFISPAKNRCFVSKCDYYCDTTHAICGSPDLKEGSVQAFLPDDTNVPRKHNKSPYRRTYSKKTQLAIWQQDMSYCQWKVKSMRQYAHGRRLLDLVDLHLMDYLIGNQDRHHYETFSVFGPDAPSYAIHLDNGRSFGKTQFDDDDILLPLRQCCLIRPSTLSTFFGYYTATKGLSETLHESLSKDPVFPVLAFKHYASLERRLHKIMKYILECMDRQSGGTIDSMVVTEFHNPLVPVPLPGEEFDTEEEDQEGGGGAPAAQEPGAAAEAAAAPGAVPIPDETKPNIIDEHPNAQNVLKAPPLTPRAPAAMPVIQQQPQQKVAAAAAAPAA